MVQKFAIAGVASAPTTAAAAFPNILNIYFFFGSGASDGTKRPSMNVLSFFSNDAYGLPSLKHEIAAMDSRNSV